ncbi:hypothetical protein BX600DRAFT_516127 [Xylariales sp. PMI_506]|nr:hypothetical protein BX600DRAFT_516127 [Xylariales sp. PMI_506]
MRNNVAAAAGAAFMWMLATCASADKVLSIHTPCADCPSGIGPDPVPVTAQFQKLDICSVVYEKHKDSCGRDTSYACDHGKSTFISTTIPCAAADGSYSTTLVTDLEQQVTFSHARRTATSTIPDGEPTPAGWKTNTMLDTVEYVYSTHFNKLGRHAIPNYEGICGTEHCGPNDQSFEFQPCWAKECHNGNCVTYDASWEYSLENEDTDGSLHWNETLYIPDDCDSAPLPAFPIAPPGCEVVKANYRIYENGRFIVKSAYYTVPNAPGFPPQLPPGSCQECQLPPGWTTIISVVTSPTPTTVTVTVPTTVTASATGDIPYATLGPHAPVTCPNDDRGVYLTQAGSSFLIQCSADIEGLGISKRELISNLASRSPLGTTADFGGCMQLCDAVSSCVAVDYFPATGECQGYSSIQGITLNNGAWAAIAIQRAGVTASTTATSTTTTDTTLSETDTTTTSTTTTDSTTTSTTTTDRTTTSTTTTDSTTTSTTTTDSTTTSTTTTDSTTTSTTTTDSTTTSTTTTDSTTTSTTTTDSTTTSTTTTDSTTTSTTTTDSTTTSTTTTDSTTTSTTTTDSTTTSTTTTDSTTTSTTTTDSTTTSTTTTDSTTTSTTTTDSTTTSTTTTDSTTTSTTTTDSTTTSTTTTDSTTTSTTTTDSTTTSTTTTDSTTTSTTTTDSTTTSTTTTDSTTTSTTTTDSTTTSTTTTDSTTTSTTTTDSTTTSTTTTDSTTTSTTTTDSTTTSTTTTDSTTTSTTTTDSTTTSTTTTDSTTTSTTTTDSTTTSTTTTDSTTTSTTTTDSTTTSTTTTDSTTTSTTTTDSTTTSTTTTDSTTTSTTTTDSTTTSTTTTDSTTTTTTTTTSSTYVSKPTWVPQGCFFDTANPRPLVYPQNVNNDHNTVETCQSSCLTSGYTYAGVENANTCFCGSAIDGPVVNYQVDSYQCNSQCTGDNTETCGGYARMFIYKYVPST